MTVFDHSLRSRAMKRAGTLLATTLLMGIASPVIAQRAPAPPAVPQGAMGAGTENRMWADAPLPQPAKPKTAQVRTYTVARGDTLGRIAQRHGCEIRQLAAANGLKPPAYALGQGQKLKLVGCSK